MQGISDPPTQRGVIPRFVAHIIQQTCSQRMQLFIMDLKESNPTQWLSLLSACTMSTGYVSSYLQKSLIITGPETQENGSNGN